MNARNEAARRRGNFARALHAAEWLTTTEKYSTEREREYARGTFWAGVGVLLTFGPMLALGMLWGWM